MSKSTWTRGQKPGATHGYERQARHQFELPPEMRVLRTRRQFYPHRLGLALAEDGQTISILTDNSGRPVVRANCGDYLRPGEVAYMIR